MQQNSKADVNIKTYTKSVSYLWDILPMDNVQYILEGKHVQECWFYNNAVYSSIQCFSFLIIPTTFNLVKLIFSGVLLPD